MWVRLSSEWWTHTGQFALGWLAPSRYNQPTQCCPDPHMHSFYNKGSAFGVQAKAATLRINLPPKCEWWTHTGQFAPPGLAPSCYNQPTHIDPNALFL